MPLGLLVVQDGLCILLPTKNNGFAIVFLWKCGLIVACSGGMHSQCFVRLWFSKISQGIVYLGDDQDAVNKTGSLRVACPLGWLWIMALHKSGVQLRVTVF